MTHFAVSGSDWVEVVGTICISSDLAGEKQMFSAAVCSRQVSSLFWSAVAAKSRMLALWVITSSSMEEVSRSRMALFGQESADA